MQIVNPMKLELLKSQACISSEAKELLKLTFPRELALHTFLDEKVQTCAFQGMSRKGGRKASGPKRPPTEYQRFVSDCLKARPSGQPVTVAMKGCALKWKARPKRKEAA